MEKLSTIERLHQSERERGRFIVHDAHQEREQRRAAEAGARHAEAVARALPDDLFFEHPEAAEAMAKADVLRQRADGLSRGFTALRLEVSSLIESIEADIREAETGLRIAAIDDAMAGDLEFSGAIALLDRIEQASKRVKVARLVGAEVSKSPPDFREFHGQAEEAEAGLRSLLLRLKREHVKAHPELLAGE